jgi:hypothetical protein
MQAIALALMLMSAPAPTPAASPSPAQSAAPLREVVYEYSESQKEEVDVGSFGADAPPTSELGAGINGRLTIDVIGVHDDGSLLITITESTNASNDRAPHSATLVIHPDGGLGVVSGVYDDAMIKLAPYFGTSYFEGHDLQVGTTWSQDSDVQQYHITTTTTVSKVDGDLATIDSTMKERTNDLHGDFSGTSSVVYDAPLLVPISLDIRLTNRDQQMGSSRDVTLHYQFDRVSDTRQQKSN